MEQISLAQLWTAAAVLAGFQFTALTWRISREVGMEASGEQTWLTWSDGVAAISFLILVLGVFVIPAIDIYSSAVAARVLGTALILFATYSFILAGHYNLYCRWGKAVPRHRVTKQELVALSLCCILLATFWIVWFVR